MLQYMKSPLLIRMARMRRIMFWMASLDIWPGPKLEQGLLAAVEATLEEQCRAEDHSLPALIWAMGRLKVNASRELRDRLLQKVSPCNCAASAVCADLYKELWVWTSYQSCA